MSDAVEADLVRGSGPRDPEALGLPYIGGVFGVDVDPADVSEVLIGVAEQRDRSGDVAPAKRRGLVEPDLEWPVQKRRGAALFEHGHHVGDGVGQHSDGSVVVAALQNVRDLEPVLVLQSREVEGVDVLGSGPQRDRSGGRGEHYWVRLAVVMPALMMGLAQLQRPRCPIAIGNAATASSEHRVVGVDTDHRRRERRA